MWAECGASRTVAIGNGQNDCDMLKAARLSIAVLGDGGPLRRRSARRGVIARDIRIALDSPSESAASGGDVATLTRDRRRGRKHGPVRR